MSKNLFTLRLNQSKIIFWIISAYLGVCIGYLTKVSLVAVNKKTCSSSCDEEDWWGSQG